MKNIFNSTLTMDVDYKDFIGIYHNVFPENFCKHLIDEFERNVSSGAGSNRQRSEKAYKHNKDDVHMELNIAGQTMTPFKHRYNDKKIHNVSVQNMFFDGLQYCYNHYSEEYSILKTDNINGSAMKMQRTNPGGGYHVWHSEQGTGDHASRVLVYTLYLNTLSEKDGGETEYLYQKRRIQPRASTMVLWPAAFTHVHRGNTVLGDQAKYIVTGWFYYG